MQMLQTSRIPAGSGPAPHGSSAESTSDSAPIRPRLDATEIRRRVWHMSPGLLPLILWLVPHRDPISPTLLGIMFAVICGLALNIFIRYRKIARPEDNQRLWAVSGYAVSVLATLVAFPAHAELGLAVLAILAFGDGSATLIGLAVGGPRLPWNRGKTWSGVAGFVLVGGTAAACIYWGEPRFNPESLTRGTSFLTAAAIAGTATVLAALIESIPSRINDNIRVGVTAAVVMSLLHFAFVVA